MTGGPGRRAPNEAWEVDPDPILTERTLEVPSTMRSTLTMAD